jgi:hypothetical protein
MSVLTASTSSERQPSSKDAAGVVGVSTIHDDEEAYEMNRNPGSGKDRVRVSWYEKGLRWLSLSSREILGHNHVPDQEEVSPSTGSVPVPPVFL